jgi:hypothetical protein
MAQPNGLDPNVQRVILPGNIMITAGTAGDDAGIKAQVTGFTAGSIYISTNATTPGIFVLVSTTWTKLTIN